MSSQFRLLFAIILHLCRNRQVRTGWAAGRVRACPDQYAKAIPPLKKARELAPRDVGSCYLLIRAYIETRQFEKALDGFERLETLDSRARPGFAF